MQYLSVTSPIYKMFSSEMQVKPTAISDMEGRNDIAEVALYSPHWYPTLAAGALENDKVIFFDKIL